MTTSPSRPLANPQGMPLRRLFQQYVPLDHCRPSGTYRLCITAAPDAKVWMFLVSLKYWILKLMPQMVYPEVLFHLNFSIKAQQHEQPGELVLGLLLLAAKSVHKS